MQTRRSGGLLVSTVLALALGTAPALAQEDEVVVDQPPPQSGVTEGEEVTVSGSDCPPNSEVAVAFNEMDVASGTAGSDGSFSITFTVPDFPEPEPGTLEPSEASIRVECGDLVGGVVVALNQADGGSSGTLPLTGLSTASLAGLTLMLTIGGLGLILAARRARSE